ncbi:SAM-dependent methyltransferase [Sphingobium subterraneum]|uniref:Cyclopropane-fatty-acyl-phospholipid synthase n=1 Tax=Sphingobium subterraneum TaxID=627688 RepID=A0A841J024_9SPHN|nr:class I SAM-dependent methyltransferase [Sphingobium subterraneum]MBB6122876.1 cyclopropane-fatty-acyl-phospholipid synthase [Sphingobium subterraneum]
MSDINEVEVSYGIDNQFYDMFLDSRKIYSCALFDGTTDLDSAQGKKLHFIADAAHVTAGQAVLDIGCGWGGNLAFLANERQASRAIGITLSEQQFQEAQQFRSSKIEVQLTDFRDYVPDRLFDAVVSIGMFEHIATPTQARTGESIDLYREFFSKAWKWTKPGAYLGLQSVIQTRLPRDLNFIRDIGSVIHGIFPGATAPRFEEVYIAASPFWEIVEMHTRREHYALTCAAWHDRLVSNEQAVVERWGRQRFAEYERYFRRISEAFSEGYGSLGQFSLRRIDR